MLRNTLDSHSKTIQAAQQQRSRNYDDELQRYDCPPPSDAPNWAYVDIPNMIYDTEPEKTNDEEDNDDNKYDEEEVLLVSDYNEKEVSDVY